MKWVFLLFLCLDIMCGMAMASPAQPRWAVYYTDIQPVDHFSDFDLLVFDSDSHPPIDALKLEHKTVLGYISLGEAERYRSYYPAVKAKHLFIKANRAWKDHSIVDIRKVEWTDYVIDVLLPHIVRQGFDGVMLDTLDSALDLEDANPKKYAGMREAAVHLVTAIHARYPHLKLMVNRGFDILPQIASSIDMEMAESIYANWQPGKKKPALFPDETYQHYVTLLKQAQTTNPSLKIYTLDYWPQTDKAGIARIYRTQRAQGFIPYVATMNLQAICKETQ